VRPKASAVIACLLLAAAPLLAEPRTAPAGGAKPAAKGSSPAATMKPPAKGSVPAAARRPPPAQQQRKLQSEQQRLQARLAQTKRRLAAAEASHSEATDALKESEAAISATNRRLRELAASRRRIERQLAVVSERSRTTAVRAAGEQRLLGDVLRAQFALSQQPAWASLLDIEPGHARDHDLAYLGYIARTSTQTIGALRDRQEELAALADEAQGKQAELVALATAEQDSQKQLMRQQATRRHTLDRLARQIGAQRQSLATLQRDEQRLSSLIEKLAQVLAEQRRRDERAALAARRPPAPGPTVAPKGRAGTADIDPAPDSRFAQLRGKLLLPVQGEVTARFGAARRTEAGVNAPTWKGVFIKASPGAEVHVVAAGRVVFADWLRGFGNLLIIDHGEGFLSVYGNNESLLAGVGERVDAGAVIAAVGNTGGNSESGLYFELRFQGRPFDPLRWAAAR
jgi:murein hydrolase activator